MENGYSNSKNLSVSNVKNICRICLSNYNNMISLYITKDNILLLDMFTSISSIKVHSGDGLPLQICELCKTELFNCYLFKIKCKKSNSILKALIKEQSEKGKDTKCSLNETFRVMDDHSINDGINSDEKPGSTDEHRRDNEEVTENRTEIDKEEFDVKVEVEYLEESIFDCSEVEVEKNHVNKCLPGMQEDNGTLQCQATGSSEKTKPQPHLKRGKKKNYTCSFCSKRFLKAQTLQSHVARSHGAQSAAAQSHGAQWQEAQSPAAHPCAQCYESFGCAADLRLHTALHARGPPWACNQCHKNFDERGKLRRHVRRHMSGKRHACERCGKQFAELCALRRHARVHTGAPPHRPHACHLCDKRYSESSALAAHVLRHEGARPCACDACGKAFPSPRLLASHRRVHDDRKPHACRYCEKRFRHVSTRNTHHRTHTGDKPYVCCACGKRFIQNSNLTLHMRTHTGEKPYSCESCDRKFSSGSALASHRRTHTGEKSEYSCSVCGKRVSRVYLPTHLRLHAGDRPFPCCACGKRFTNGARLRQHHFIHTQEKAFECAMCSQKFETKGYLAKHLKNHEMIKNLQKQNVLVMEQVDRFRSYFVATNGKSMNMNDCAACVLNIEEPAKDNGTVEVKEKMPMEVSGEITLPNDGHVKTEQVVINGEDHGNICLQASGVN